MELMLRWLNIPIIWEYVWMPRVKWRIYFFCLCFFRRGFFRPMNHRLTWFKRHCLLQKLFISKWFLNIPPVFLLFYQPPLYYISNLPPFSFWLVPPFHLLPAASAASHRSTSSFRGWHPQWGAGPSRCFDGFPQDFPTWNRRWNFTALRK